MAYMASIADEIRYGYAVGRVRVLEGRLLSRSSFERLIDAGNLRDQKRILAETHVGRYFDTVQTAEDVERALEMSLADLYDEFLTRAGLPSAVVRYFQLPYDYANLRLVVKARVLGTDGGEQLSTLGSIEPDAFAGDGAALPDGMRGLLTAWDSAESAPSLDDIESAIDRAFFDALCGAAKESGLRFLRELTRLRIDLANTRLLIRARVKALPPGELLARLIPAGSPALERLAPTAPRLSASELAAAIADTRVLGRLSAEDLADVGRFDLTADAMIADRMLSARMMPSGADPVLAYVLGREAEARLLRIAVAGRLSGLDPDVVRERVKERVR